MDIYNFMTLVDENTTRYCWFQMRNFAPGERLRHGSALTSG